MPYLELRRHTTTKPGWVVGHGTAISRAGVALARRIGAGVGPFALVVASDVPRTAETALAMGFAVDETDPALTAHDLAIHHEVERFGRGKRLPFAAWAELVGRRGAVHAHARVQHARWLALAARLPDDGAALVLSHGGTIEPGVTVCLDRGVWGAWGPLRPCEGVRLTVRAGVVVAGRVLRV